MNDSNDATDMNRLRDAAEQRVHDAQSADRPESPDLLRHELTVHQIELQLQNAQLRETIVELEEARERLLDLYDFAPVGYITIDTHGTILEGNLKAARMLGLERSRLLQRRLVQFTAPESRTSLALLLPRALDSKDGLVAELWLQRVDGTTFPVRLEFLARTPDVCRVALTDITTEKNAQEQLMRLNETLEKRVAERTSKIRELNKEFETVTQAVAEDLTLSFRRVASFMEMLRREAPDALGTDATHFSHVFRSVDRVEGMVRALLEYSRVSRMRLRLRPVDLNRVFLEVRKDLQPLMAGRSVRLASDPLPTVQGDTSAMQLIFRELLGNAVKFSAGRDDASIHVDVQETESEFIFCFRDNGAGFNNRHKEKLFDVFRRLHPESAFQGVGLGLALVKRTCARFGARIWGEGKPGEGATFWVAWPKDPILLD